MIIVDICNTRGVGHVSTISDNSNTTMMTKIKEISNISEL